MNRRDYPGSTNYTDDNLKDLNEGNVSFMERLGAEVAHLVWFAETQNIPKISADGKSGGFSVMGWSMGNATSMAVLGCPEFVGQAAYTRLEPYLRQLILYGTQSSHILLAVVDLTKSMIQILHSSPLATTGLQRAIMLSQ